MDARLEAIASLVEAGSELIDIGSDHGFLPLFLLESGVVSHVSVSDIGEGPLLNAKKTLEGKYADFYLADGLPKQGLFDSAVIAGMGGHTIAGIIEKDRKRFAQMRYVIVQPMQHLRELREYLLRHGFRVIKERLVFEAHYYVIMKVVPGEDTPYDLDLGKDFSQDKALYEKYLDWHKKRILSFLEHLEGERALEMAELLERIDQRLQDMI